MQKLVKHTLYLFLCITGLTAAMTLAGIGYAWFFSEAKELPHLEWLIGSVIIEVVAVILMLAKKGLKYLPDTQTDKEPKDTLKFMESFISTGTSATVVSNRVSWLAGDDKLISILQSKIEKGTRIEIITPNEVPEVLREKLNGASFIVTRENVSPEARFTLVNGDRSGAEKLAIARGVHPDHEITIFDNNSGPQIIAMAKDIIRKSKELTNAA
ncbi:TPA: hypothetical protein NJ348_004476 [Vibrio parahaemolyticus]|uniref:Uncharacterized protein n=1 Tax=Vibrio proteolyticus NBRC 13287 TaxID=1219065 RepID=U3BIU1_VIBPR|nr:hypothetical protein [Vibrio proteolyticus]EJR0962092.1 hypothetical protein [Vibrio parahaemolyticus]TBT28581.1 hypothetical protein D5E85_24690 [Vibrio parahaemolyticus]GAD69554.1 hypothetical protein VPR01S_37_00090 [Vibrio proteolyticus NBRC 13287]HAS6997961.1 hypothetical protein [Vibrio parahaemolyticus]HCG7147280.1 hypothetical protein [Vibrio parahaemolyticus]